MGPRMRLYQLVLASAIAILVVILSSTISEIDAEADDMVISISAPDSDDLEPGKSVTVTVSVYNNDDGFRACAFIIHYDTHEFRCISCKISPEFSNQGLTSIGNVTLDDGLLIQLICNDYDDVIGDGTLVELTFETLPQIAGDKTISLDMDDPTTVFVNRDGETLNCKEDVMDSTTVTVIGYPVRFYVDGTLFHEVVLTKLSTVKAPGDTPTKSSTVEYEYTFEEWSGLTADTKVVDSALEFHAVFTQQLREYQISFISEGSVFHSESIGYGTVIQPPSNTPVKNGDSKYSTYTFSGWNGLKDGMTVTGDMEFNASFLYSDPVRYDVTVELSSAPENLTVPTMTDIPYGQEVDITWLWVYGYDVSVTLDGKTLHDDSFTMPDHDVTLGATFSKISIPDSGGDSSPSYYTIRFVSEDTLIASYQLKWYSIISTPETIPTKESTESHTFTFKEWKGYHDGIRATGNMTFEAVFEQNDRMYAVKFMDGILEIQNQSLRYGASIVAPSIQMPDGFIGWTGYTDGMTVTGDHQFDASYEGTGNGMGSEMWVALAAVAAFGGAVFLRIRYL